LRDGIADERDIAFAGIVFSALENDLGAALRIGFRALHGDYRSVSGDNGESGRVVIGLGLRALDNRHEKDG
jgi:hypothetical protein